MRDLVAYNRASWSTSGSHSREFPRGTVLSSHESLSLVIPHDSLLFNIPLYLPAQPKSDVSKMTRDHRIMSDLDVRVRTLARSHAIDEILDVQKVIVLRAGPLPGNTHRLVDPFPCGSFGFGINFPASPLDHQHPLLALKRH